MKKTKILFLLTFFISFCCLTNVEAISYSSAQWRLNYSNGSSDSTSEWNDIDIPQDFGNNTNFVKSLNYRVYGGSNIYKKDNLYTLNITQTFDPKTIFYMSDTLSKFSITWACGNTTSSASGCSRDSYLSSYNLRIKNLDHSSRFSILISFIPSTDIKFVAFDVSISDPFLFYASGGPSGWNGLPFKVKYVNFQNLSIEESTGSDSVIIGQNETIINQNQTNINQNNEIIKGQEELNDNITSEDSSGATGEAGDFFSGFTTDTFGLTSVVTAPLSLINSITSNSCSSINLPIPFVNKTLTLPCMNSIYNQHFSSVFTLYQTITFGITSYWVCVRIFNLVKDFKNPDHDEIEVMEL